jgi:hypothetical protein
MIIGVSMCDFCGKRTTEFSGQLTLSSVTKGRCGIRKTKGWQLCKTCYTKISGISTVGDNIRESIEVQLDKLRADNANIKMLASITR